MKLPLSVRLAAAREALFVVGLGFAGCGAFFFGLGLAASADCKQFARFSPGGLLVGPCERYGSIAAATPYMLLGAALLVCLFVVPRRTVPLPAEPPRRIGRGFKLVLALIGAWSLVDGIRMALGAPCSEFLVPGSIQYRAVGEGLAKLCEMVGPAIPASLFILFGALLLVALFKGWLEDEA